MIVVDAPMPKTCYDCKLTSGDICVLTQRIVRRQKMNNEKLYNCPIKGEFKEKNQHGCGYL